MDNVQRGRTTILGPRAQSGSQRLLGLRGWTIGSKMRGLEAWCSYGSKWPVHSTPKNTSPHRPLAKVSRLPPAPPQIAPPKLGTCTLSALPCSRRTSRVPLASKDYISPIPLFPAIQTQPVGSFLNCFVFIWKKKKKSSRPDKHPRASNSLGNVLMAN